MQSSLSDLYTLFNPGTPIPIDATALTLSPFGEGTGPIHLDDVRCNGFEDALVNCTYDSNTADCLHFEDAGVRCQRKLLSILILLYEC